MKRFGRLLILMFALSCAQAAPTREAPARSQKKGPSIPATVLTMRESSHPPTRAFLHKIVVAGPNVRMGDEKDQWRLFDLERRTVTWVDDVARTYRTLSLEELVRERERRLREPVPAAGVSRVSVTASADTMEIAGVHGKRMTMELGGYRREVWISDEPLVSPLFMRMLVASEPISEPWAGVMRDAQRALMDAEGFPIWDRSRLEWKGGELVYQRRLVKIEKKDVPAEWVAIPAGYTDAAANRAPARTATR